MKTETIFLTGGTGVLGAHLLKQLLADTKAQLCCLVRAPDQAAGLERLRNFLAVYDPQLRLRDEFDRRVEVVLGDVTQERLGLSPEAHASLASRVDQTIHSAAFTNLFSKFKPIEAINVGGTRNIIAFALKTTSKRLCYVSTYTVVGDKTFDESVVFTERDFDIGQGFEDMNYQHTKFIGERLVRDAASEGLVWNIVRPGQIFGESGTGYYPQGHTNVSGLFYDIFKTIIETGVAFHSGTYFDITPVDYVSRGIVHLVVQRNARFETYHLSNPDERTYSDIVGMIQSLGYGIEMVSEDRYREMLAQKSLRVNNVEYTSITTKAFRWWFRRDRFRFRSGARTDTTYTANLLADAGIVCPKIDRELLGTYLQRGVETDYLPAPGQPVSRLNIAMAAQEEKSL